MSLDVQCDDVITFDIFPGAWIVEEVRDSGRVTASAVDGDDYVVASAAHIATVTRDLVDA